MRFACKNELLGIRRVFFPIGDVFPIPLSFMPSIMLIKLKGISQNMLNILNIRFFIKATPLATTSRVGRSYKL